MYSGAMSILLMMNVQTIAYQWATLFFNIFSPFDFNILPLTCFHYSVNVLWFVLACTMHKDTGVFYPALQMWLADRGVGNNVFSTWILVVGERSYLNHFTAENETTWGVLSPASSSLLKVYVYRPTTLQAISLGDWRLTQTVTAGSTS